jgi:hypothetical protein
VSSDQDWWRLLEDSRPGLTVHSFDCMVLVSKHVHRGGSAVQYSSSFATWPKCPAIAGWWVSGTGQLAEHHQPVGGIVNTSWNVASTASNALTCRKPQSHQKQPNGTNDSICTLQQPDQANNQLQLVWSAKLIIQALSYQYQLLTASCSTLFKHSNRFEREQGKAARSPSQGMCS